MRTNMLTLELPATQEYDAIYQGQFLPVPTRSAGDVGDSVLTQLSAGYQFTFEDNTQWSEFLAAGPEIQQYLLATARKYNVYQYCKFQHLFHSARWDAGSGKWDITIEDLLTGEVCSAVLTRSRTTAKDMPELQ